MRDKALKMHENGGKLAVASKVPLETKEDLSLAYSPGVAEPCKEIHKDESLVYKYTSKQNMVAVVTDGTAVLGLGNIGPKAALPVMEGKALLFKQFADVDAVPICLDTTDVDEIVRTVELIAPTYGGINLEDISGPRCIEVETRLKEILDIPVFHDDQHGTAIVTLAALINALKITKKDVSEIKVVVSGTGAAGSAIIKLLLQYGVKHIKAINRSGILHNSKREKYDKYTVELLDAIGSPSDISDDSIGGALKGADVFVGVSAAGLVNKEMVKSMNENPVIFAMANPVPEIMPEDALEAGALIVGTGRSDYPNQINNVLAFPGIFRGALDARAKAITEEMKIATAKAIANLITDEELTTDYIIPSPFDKRVYDEVAKCVYDIAIKDNNK